MKLVLAVVALGAALLCAVEGCGPSCDVSAPDNFKVCPLDPNPTMNQIKSCQDAQMSVCGGQYNNWISCVVGNTKCDPVTNASDPASKIAAKQMCQDKLQAYTDCASPKM